MKRLALVLVALLIVPAALAQAPQPAGAWSYDAPTGVLAVAVSDRTAIAAAGLAAATPPAASTVDVAAFHPVDGLLWQNSVSPRAAGKDKVVISLDGSAVVAANREPASATTPPNLVFFRTNNALTTNPVTQAESMSAVWSKRLANPVTALAVSGNGGRAVVAEEGSVVNLRMYTASGDERTVRAPGNVTGLALREDGLVLAVSGRERAPDGTSWLGYLALVNVDSGAISKHGAGPGSVTSVAFARDGSVLLAGTEDGRLLHFRPTASTLSFAEQTLPLDLGALTSVTLAGSGRAAVVGAERGFAVLTFSDGLATVAYRRESADPVRAVDVTADGSYILVVARDASGHLATGPEPLWTIPGPFFGGAMDDDARVLVLNRGSAVQSFGFLRAHAFRHLADGQVVETVAPRVPDASGVARFTARVVSEGSAFDRIRIVTPQVAGVEFDVEPDTVELPPGGSADVNISVRPVGLAPGTYEYTATARSALGDTEQNLTLPVTVTSRTGYTIALEGAPERVIQRGQTDAAVFLLRNLGNVPVNATLRVSQAVSAGSLWTVEVEPRVLSIPAGASTSAVITVAPPSASPNGTVDRVLLSAESDQGTVSAAVTYTLSPDLGVSIDTPTRVRFVGPAQSAWFNITVLNTGSVRTAYEVYYDIVSQTGQGWNVDVDLSRFNISARESRTIPLRILAPNTGSASDRVTLFFEVRTVERLNRLEPMAAENITLIANLNPDLRPKPPDWVPEDGRYQLPAPALPWFALALVAAAALVARRRKGDSA